LKSCRAVKALQAPLDLMGSLALGSTPGGVGTGVGIVAQPRKDDGVQSTVELTVPGAVQPVTSDLPGRDWDRAGPGQSRERRLGAQPPGI